MSKAIKYLLISFLMLGFFQVQAQRGEELIRLGDDAYKRENYAQAISLYIRFLVSSNNENSDRTFPYGMKGYNKPKDENQDSTAGLSPKELLEMEVRFKLAQSYFNNFDYETAESQFDSIVKKNPGGYPLARYWLGVSLMKNKKYQKAFQEFEKFMSDYPDKESSYYNSADELTFSCFFALDSADYKKGVNIFPIDSINKSGTSNFGINYYLDSSSIIFSSARDGNLFPENFPHQGHNISDLFIATMGENGYSQVTRLNTTVNTPLHEGAACLSLDKSTFYFTRWSGTKKEECSIFMSKSINGNWLPPIKLNENVNIAGTRSMQPSLSPDESILYFVSDRPGGEGKYDIWFCSIDDDGNTGPAKNLGPKVNSPENEVTPFYHFESQTLYFSSEGHLGVGGLDIFKAYKTDTTWSTPKNIGRPYNSSRDDSYFILSRGEMSGFFSSDRNKCGTCSGGYCLEAYSFTLDQPPIKFSISGIVYEKETKKPLSNSLVSFMDVKGDIETFFVTTDENGYYTSMVREETETYLKAQKKRHFGDAATISTIGLKESKDFIQDFYLRQIPDGDMVIPGIEYDYDKATLRPESKKVLDELVDFLKLNDNIIIEISSHTDERGNDAYNMKLSGERAKSVVNYLIFNDIDKNRLMAKGYGESKLLIAEAKSEDDHQKNRRTAFRILSEDFKPVPKIRYKNK